MFKRQMKDGTAVLLLMRVAVLQNVHGWKLIVSYVGNYVAFCGGWEIMVLSYVSCSCMFIPLQHLRSKETIGVYIYLIYPIVKATGVRYIPLSWQRISHCHGNRTGCIG